MGDLINVRITFENDIPIVNSKEVSTHFNKQHSHVLRDIDSLKKDVSNFGEMFLEVRADDSYGRQQRAYMITRDGFSLLAMGFTGTKALEWKLKYIEAFNQIEKEWNSPEKVMARALKLADQRIHSLSTQIQQDKPKVIFADAVSASHTSILIGDLAKLIKQNGVEIGQKRLFAWMRDNSYLIKRQGSDYNMPMQRYMEQGLFEIKETAITHSDGHISISKTVKVTGKGQLYFINKFVGDKAV